MTRPSSGRVLNPRLISRLPAKDIRVSEHCGRRKLSPNSAYDSMMIRMVIARLCSQVTLSPGQPLPAYSGRLASQHANGYEIRSRPMVVHHKRNSFLRQSIVTVQPNHYDDKAAEELEGNS
jgi:hypothetical protein